MKELEAKIKHFYGDVVTNNSHDYIFKEENAESRSDTNAGNLTLRGDFLVFPNNKNKKGGGLYLTKYKIKGGFFLGRDCDGVCFEVHNNRLTLIEIKTTLDFDKYQEAISQMAGSLVKTLQLLSLIEDIDRHIQVINAIC